jgi:threonyl-tRNA synthetase
MNSKIRDAQLQKVPYMLIVGDKETGADAAAVRLLNGKNLGPMQIAALKERLKMEITAKRSVLSID